MNTYNRNLRKALAIVRDEIIIRTDHANQAASTVKKLELKQLYKARNNDPDFHSDLAKMLNGTYDSHEEYSCFPGRASRELADFFDNAGLIDEVGSYVKTNIDWLDEAEQGDTLEFVTDILETLTVDGLSKVVGELFKGRYFSNYADVMEKAANDSATQGCVQALDAESYQKEAQERFQAFINNSIKEDDGPNLAYLLNIPIPLNFIFPYTPSTDDENLNALIKQAEKLFMQPGDQNKRMALEQIWGAFERVRTHYGKTKADKEKLTKMPADGLLHKQLQKEINNLGDIGNNYLIRHKDKVQIKITDPEAQTYLFIKTFNLIHLLLLSISKDKANNTST